MSIKPYFPIKIIGYRALYDIYHIILHTYIVKLPLLQYIQCVQSFWEHKYSIFIDVDEKCWGR